MTGTTAQQPSADDGTELPRPRRGSRWRWSRPRQALVAGGALAAVLGLGVATGAGAATTSGTTGAAAPGRPPGGQARPTVAGKVTALSGDEVTVETSSDASVTVLTSSGTTFESGPGPNAGTTSSASALKVGDFIGVQGTKNGEGTVTASTVLIGRPPGTGRGRAGGTGPRSGTPPSGAPTA
jgi:hypothetical protein